MGLSKPLRVGHEGGCSGGGWGCFRGHAIENWYGRTFAAPKTRAEEHAGAGEVRVPERIRRLYARHVCTVVIRPGAARSESWLHSCGAARGLGGVGPAWAGRLVAGSRRRGNARDGT